MTDHWRSRSILVATTPERPPVEIGQISGLSQYLHRYAIIKMLGHSSLPIDFMTGAT